MKPRTMVLMAVAIVCGVLATILTASLTPDKPADGPENAVETDSDLVRVVVARQDLREGLSLTEPDKLLKVVHYRKGDEPKGFRSSVEALKGRALARTVNADQPLKETDLQPE